MEKKWDNIVNGHNKTRLKLNSQCWFCCVLSTASQLFSGVLLCCTIKWVETYDVLPKLHLSPWSWLILRGYKGRMTLTQNCHIHRMLQGIAWNLEGKISIQVPLCLLWRTPLLFQGKFHYKMFIRSFPQEETTLIYFTGRLHLSVVKFGLDPQELVSGWYSKAWQQHDPCPWIFYCLYLHCNNDKGAYFSFYVSLLIQWFFKWRV